MRHSISPYPENVKIKGDYVFMGGKFIGTVEKMQNWGKDFLARPESYNDDYKKNAFFKTRTDATNYLLNHHTQGGNV